MKNMLFINKNANLTVKSELKNNFREYLPALIVFTLGMLLIFSVGLGLFGFNGVLTLNKILGLSISIILADLIMFFGYVKIMVSSKKIFNKNTKNAYNGDYDSIYRLNDIVVYSDQSSQRVYQIIDSISTLNIDNQPYDNTITIILKHVSNIDRIISINQQYDKNNLTIQDKAIIDANAPELTEDQLFNYVENIKEFIKTTQSINNDNLYKKEYDKYFAANSKYLNEQTQSNEKVQAQLTDYINKEQEFVNIKTKESINIISDYASKK